MKKQARKPDIKKIEKALAMWQKSHLDINSLRKVYHEKVLDWVVSSMEFEKEPVSMSRLKELLEKEKTAPSL